MYRILVNLALFFIISLVANLFNATAGEPEHTGQVQQGLSAGSTIVSLQQQHDLGMVGILAWYGNAPIVGNTTPTCSGVLIANDWALTAGHCVDVDEGIKTHWIRHPDTNGAWFGTDAVYKFGYLAGDPSGPDLGLLHLTAPVPLNGRTRGFRNRFWTGAVLNRTVALFGLGTQMTNYWGADFNVNSVTGPANRNLIVTSVAKGTLQSGSITIVGGDSGGPGFIWDNGVPFLISINTNTNTVVSIPANHEWITAVTKSQWFPNRPTNSIGVDRVEINATVWKFGALGQVPWALPQRSATELCSRRSMAGGHYEGTEQNSVVNLQCSNRVNVAYFDANPATDPSIPADWRLERFSDIDTVPWAAANRAAERICNSKGQGFAGGHFNGHQGSNGKGLFCFRNAQWFDSENVPIGDLNTVTWSEAARIAKAFCLSKGASSGFFNGHQVTVNDPRDPRKKINKKGIVCF